MACALGLLSGCAALGLREPVQVHVVGMEPLPGEGMEARMALKLRVQNPNESALDYDGISVTLEMRGMTFATGVSGETGSVPRYGETVISVPVSVPAIAVIRQMVAAASGDPTRMEYALRGRLSGAGWGSTRFESKGELQLPKGLGAQ
jgi:LEA14-like dessication related protein